MYEFTKCSVTHKFNTFVLIEVKGLVERLVEGLFCVIPKTIPEFIKLSVEAEEITEIS